jgi:hypothetical protein
MIVASPCDQDGYAPLHYAAKNGHSAVVAALLAAGVNVDAPDQVRRAVRRCLQALWSRRYVHQPKSCGISS